MFIDTVLELIVQSTCFNDVFSTFCDIIGSDQKANCANGLNLGGLSLEDWKCLSELVTMIYCNCGVHNCRTQQGQIL